MIYTLQEKLEDSKEIILIPITKKATADEFYEFRSLMAHAAKILVKIIYNRIESIVEKQLSNDQFGFRRNKGTIDLKLKNICRKKTLNLLKTF